MRVVFWGTYDTGKPRVRILLAGLRQNGVEVIECREEIWRGIEDKSQVNGLARKVKLAVRWLFAYPVLVWRYRQLPRHDVVIVGYLGHLDVLVLWPLAKLRGVPIVWDAFLSLYNTVVEDRRLVSRRNPVAGILWAWEWLACKAADLVVLDTSTHGSYFVETLRADRSKVRTVFVGAEDSFFSYRPQDKLSTAKAPTVLFYGQFIPLHGIDTVVRAAKLSERDGIRWKIIGTGQEATHIQKLIDELQPANLEWVEWVPYEKLNKALYEATVCLGIFGATAKAAMVIPNKAFQVLMAGRPLITRDSPAIRELVTEGAPGIWLVPPADPEALAAAVRTALHTVLPDGLHGEIRQKIGPAQVARNLQMQMQSLLHRKP